MELGKGKKVLKVSKNSEITEQTYYRWRMDYKCHRLYSAADYRTLVAFAAGCCSSGFRCDQLSRTQPSSFNPILFTQTGTMTGEWSITLSGFCFHMFRLITTIHTKVTA